MDMLSSSSAVLASFIVATSLAAGLNLYTTVFLLGLVQHIGVSLPHGLATLANPVLMILCVALFILEFLFDKTPGRNLIWNAVQAFGHIVLATLLAYTAGAELPPDTRALITGAGTAFATFAHFSRAELRIQLSAIQLNPHFFGLHFSEAALAILVTAVALYFPSKAGDLTIAICGLASVAIWLNGHEHLNAWRRERDRMRSTPLPV